MAEGKPEKVRGTLPKVLTERCMSSLPVRQFLKVGGAVLCGVGEV